MFLVTFFDVFDRKKRQNKLPMHTINRHNNVMIIKRIKTHAYDSQSQQ